MDYENKKKKKIRQMLTTLGYQQREFPTGNKKEIYPKISAY